MTLHPGNGPVLSKASVEIDNGKIKKIYRSGEPYTALLESTIGESRPVVSDAHHCKVGAIFCWFVQFANRPARRSAVNPELDP